MKSFLIKKYRSFRRFKYAFLSQNKNIEGDYIAHQPLLCNGSGRLVFGENVNFGVINSPKFYDSYSYIEARSKNSVISFGNNVHINNALSIVSENQIIIGDNVLIGYNCNISDSNFHNLEVDKRMETDPNPQKVKIGNNVFIGNNVTILKGVSLGENTVVASGSVVTKSVVANSIIAGVPAKIINSL